MLTIRLLGEMAVLRDGEALALPPSKKTRALLGYLVATGRPQRRERLCTLLWEVPDDPRGALRWSLSKLRALVDEPDGTPRILADRDMVGWTPEGARCDLLALRDVANRPPGELATETLLAVAAEVGGDFLEGLDLPGQPDFQAWCLAEREDARRHHAMVLATLTARLAESAPEAALPHARRLVELDGYAATPRATLVGLLARLGRREEAEGHCETGLRLLREAGLPPGPLAAAERDLRATATTWRAALPAAEPPPGAATRSPQAREDGPKQVVVVDDEPELARMIAEYLGSHGFAARTASGGPALDTLLLEMPADLVVLDVNMPGEDGFAIARRLCATPGGPRILFLTAADEVTDRVAGLELGADDYLTKPFDLRELRARIRAILRDVAEAPRAAPPPAAAASPAAPAAPAAKPESHSRPSLAVLPFRSLGEDADQDLLVDGVVEDLIAALSHLRWFIVIARNSSFAYKGRLVPAPQVGQELGVQYVVEGAVRRAGERVRITVQLVETATGTPVWADRFDGSLADVFSLQDEVVARIVTALEPNLRRAEIARLRRQPPSAVPRAYEAYLRASVSLHPMTAPNCAAAIALLDRALADDPGFGLALAAAAWCRMWRAAQDLTGGLSRAEEAEMIRLAEAALAAAPDDPTVLAQVSMVFAWLGYRLQAALGLSEQAVALHPNSALAHAVAGWVQVYAGQPAEAIAQFGQAVRLDPLDPSVGEPMAGIAMAELLSGRTEAAIACGERAVAASPDCMTAHRALVAALGLAGRQAGEAVARMLALAPDFSLGAYGRLRARHAAHPLHQMLMEGMRRAGVPAGEPG